MVEGRNKKGDRRISWPGTLNVKEQIFPYFVALSPGHYKPCFLKTRINIFDGLQSLKKEE